MIRDSLGEYLCFVFQTPEGSCVDDAVAITLIFVTVGMRLLRNAPTARVLDAYGIRGKRIRVRHARSLKEEGDARKQETAFKEKGHRINRGLVIDLPELLLRRSSLSREFHLGGFQLLLNLGDVGGFNFGGNGLVPPVQRTLPVSDRHLQTPGLLVHIG